MKIGTKSVLFGAHQFALHPWFVAWGWWKLYGFPWDPRLWVAFFVHDLGYIGKPNMDGPEGETHPILGARIMARLFDSCRQQTGLLWFVGDRPHSWGDQYEVYHGGITPWCDDWGERLGRWGQFSLLHSRFYSKQLGLPFSRLCVADKLAIALTPAWLYLPMVRATGEIREYMKLADSRNLAGDPQGKYVTMQTRTQAGEEAWYADVQDYVRRWAYEHRDGREDTWTPEQRKARSATGVWQ